ncbi:hypothetical protein PTKIN_Ptkin13bG0140400 [Pterospermum kingtungense]
MQNQVHSQGQSVPTLLQLLPLTVPNNMASAGVQSSAGLQSTLDPTTNVDGQNSSMQIGQQCRIPNMLGWTNNLNLQNQQQLLQQQLMALQNNLTIMHQLQLGVQSNISGLQQQQLIGTQLGKSKSLQMQQLQQRISLLQSQSTQLQLLLSQMQSNSTQLQQLMFQIQSQPTRLQQQHLNQLKENTQQRLQASNSLFQSQNLVAVTETSSNSTPQTGHVNGSDWQEEAYQKIKTMKEAYLPELNEIYQKVATKLQKLQQDDSLQQQAKPGQLEKLKLFKSMLERIISFLLSSRANISPSVGNKLGSYEKQIINFVNTNKRKPVSTPQHGQLHPPYMHSMQ